MSILVENLVTNHISRQNEKSFLTSLII